MNKRNKIAPIALFVYNRPKHTLRTLQALAANDLAKESVLYIFSDGPKENSDVKEILRINEVRKIIRSREWCREIYIYERERNVGLDQSIIEGVTEIINKHGKIIVLEDDVETSKGFLTYINNALDVYENENRVMSVTGYMFPVKTQLTETFFVHSACPWGWGTWKRAWDHFSRDARGLATQIEKQNQRVRFNMDNSCDYYAMLKRQSEKEYGAWDVCWYASLFLAGGLSLFPHHSLVRNIGHDGSGIHIRKDWRSKWYHQQDIIDFADVVKQDPIENKEAREAIISFYQKVNKVPIRVRVKEKLQLILQGKTSG